MSKKINVGLVGVGRMGMVYAEDLAYRVPQANLVAASDTNLAVEASARALGVSKWYPDYQDLIADKEIDKEKIDQGLIGTPVLFKASSRDPFRPSLEYMNPQHSGGLMSAAAAYTGTTFAPKFWARKGRSKWVTCAKRRCWC